MDTPSFGQDHFGAANLGHKARNACLVKAADRIHRHPGGTVPDKFASPAHYRSLVDLANRPEVTHEAVRAPHRQRTFWRMADVPGDVLLIHDTTELDYSGLASLAADLGPIGNGRGRGYLCHNTLAIDPARREVLGLAHQILHRRDPAPPHESVAAKRLRASRESRLWTQAVQALDGAAAGQRWIDVADRGADLFEFLAWEVKRNRPFVVRSTHNRVAERVADDGARTYLHTYAETLPAWGERVVTVRGRDGAPDRKARLAVSAAAVRVQPPHVRRGEYDKQPLDLWVVRVWEVDPPAGAAPLEWFLLTNVPVATVADAWERVSWYECRWIAEEFHKAQKTGCGIETLQFTTVAALQPVIALLSVVATTLLNLRAASRHPEAKTRPATEIIDADYVEVLSVWRYKEKRPDLTVHEFFFALARLGGHQNRKRDGDPGWLVLWRGWMKLELLQTGYRIRQQS
jgi:hypothetical protein